jgi:hypothetical protein
MAPAARPLIVLCPPRSFSSVVCAMIGQHPRLYAFPELNLFVADRVHSILELSDEPGFLGPSNYMSGLIRSIAQLFFSGQTRDAVAKAQAWIDSRRHWTTQAMMDTLLARIDPLLGLEKSTRTALSRTSLRRALAWCPEARFLHLTRHPVTAIESMQKCQADLSPGGTALWNEVGLREYCASIWLHAHQSALRFTSTLASPSTLRLKAEDILRHPDDHLSRIASWLDLPCESGDIRLMKHPEKWPFARPAAGLPKDCDSSFFSDPQLRTISEVPPVETIRAWALSAPVAAELQNVANMLNYR